MKTRIPRKIFLFLMIFAVLSANIFAAASYGGTTEIAALRSDADIVVPSPLKTGDKVGIIAPARRADDPERLRMTVEFLTGKGFEVVVADNIDYETELNLGGGSEQIRADAFNALARDPDIKAIFCLRGGYASMHLLPYIDYMALRQNRPIFVGYSDITAMHAAIFQKTGLVTFHGPML